MNSEKKKLYRCKKHKNRCKGKLFSCPAVHVLSHIRETVFVLKYSGNH